MNNYVNKNENKNNDKSCIHYTLTNYIKNNDIQ